MYYGNANMKMVKRNQKLHDSDSALLIGDVVKEINESSYIDTQTSLFKFVDL